MINLESNRNWNIKLKNNRTPESFYSELQLR